MKHEKIYKLREKVLETPEMQQLIFQQHLEY